MNPSTNAAIAYFNRSDLFPHDGNVSNVKNRCRNPNDPEDFEGYAETPWCLSRSADGTLSPLFCGAGIVDMCGQ